MLYKVWLISYNRSEQLTKGPKMNNTETVIVVNPGTDLEQIYRMQLENEYIHLIEEMNDSDTDYIIL